MSQYVNIIRDVSPTADSYYDVYVPSRANDGSLTTTWINIAAGTHWWKVDLGSGFARVAVSLKVLPGLYSGSDYGFKTGVVKGSNDDSSWDTLCTTSPTNDGSWQEFSFANSTAYRYYKIDGITGWSGDGNTIVVKEFQLLEENTDDSSGYGSDVLTGGTASAIRSYSADYLPAEACDNVVDTAGNGWYDYPSVFPTWWKYDFGVGVTKTIKKLTLESVIVSGGNSGLKEWVLSGSNNDTDYVPVAMGTQANNADKQTYTFENDFAFRYYKVTVDSDYAAAGVYIQEIEMMEETPATGTGFMTTNKGWL